MHFLPQVSFASRADISLFFASTDASLFPLPPATAPSPPLLLIPLLSSFARPLRLATSIQHRPLLRRSGREVRVRHPAHGLCGRVPWKLRKRSEYSVLCGGDTGGDILGA